MQRARARRTTALMAACALLGVAALCGAGCPTSAWDPSVLDAVRRDAGTPDGGRPDGGTPDGAVDPDAPSPSDAADAPSPPDGGPVDTPSLRDGRDDAEPPDVADGAGADGADVPSDAAAPDCATDEDCVGRVEVATCEVARCAVGGTCVVRAAADGTACDDGDPCTDGDACRDGTCGGGAAEGCCAADGDCDDGDPCTTARCDETTRRCGYDTVACPPAGAAGCTATVCRGEGRCDPLDLVRPVVIWERGLEPGEAGGLRTWPATGWLRVEAGAHAGVGALQTVDGTATLRLPPVRVPAGTVVFDAWLWQSGVDCPAAGTAALVTWDGGSHDVPCLAAEGWTRVVVPVGADEDRSVALSVEGRTAPLRLDDLRLVHHGREGCPVGAPHEIATGGDATHLDASEGALGVSLVWAEAATTVLLATGVSPDAGTPVGVPLAADYTPDFLFDVAVATAGGATAVAWGGVSTSRDCRGWLDTGTAPPPAEFALVASGSGRNVLPRVARAGEGVFQYVWALRSGSAREIWTQRFGAHGEPTSAPQRVAVAAEAPDIAQLADGDLVVVWAATDAAAIRARRLSAAEGAPIAEARDVAAVAAPGGSMGRPRVAALADGGWVVVWEAEHEGTDGVDVGVRRFGSDDAPTVDLAIANDVTEGDQETPTVLARPSDGFTVVWSSNEDLPAARALRYRVFDGAGPVAPASPAAPDTAPGTVDQRAPTVAALPPNGPVLAWIDDTTGAIDWTVLPGACPLGWWTCQADQPHVCTPGGYLPLLGLCEGDGCRPSRTCL